MYINGLRWIKNKLLYQSPHRAEDRLGIAKSTSFPQSMQKPRRGAWRSFDLWIMGLLSGLYYRCPCHWYRYQIQSLQRSCKCPGSTQMFEKKKKYLKDCLEQRCHFTPFVVSMGWSHWRGSKKPAEETIHPTCREMGETVCCSVWIYQWPTEVAYKDPEFLQTK
jgi:hypothetical protein